MALVLTPNTSAICAAVRGSCFSESSSKAAYRNGCEMTRSTCRVRTSNTSGRSSYRGAGCGPAGLSRIRPPSRVFGFPARHRAATSAPSCRSCPNRALSESCTSPCFARSADHIRSHSCIPPLYKHLYKHHRRLTRRMFRGHPSLCAGRVTLCAPAPSGAMTKTLAITGIWGYRHCARGRAA